MSTAIGTKNKNIFQKLVAPLLVVKEEKLYLIWAAFTFFFGLINIWAAMLLGDNENILAALKEGIVYTYSISICAPFLGETLITVVQCKKENKKLTFSTYRMATSALNIILLLVLSFLWMGEYKDEVVLQFVVACIMTFFSFYMYCISQMDRHMAYVGEFEDDNYLDVENASIAKTGHDAGQLEKIAGAEGDIEV